MQWTEVFTDFGFPRWSVEANDTSLRWRHARCFFRILLPHVAWSGLRMSDEIRTRRLVVFVLVACAGLWTTGVLLDIVSDAFSIKTGAIDYAEAFRLVFLESYAWNDRLRRPEALFPAFSPAAADPLRLWPALIVVLTPCVPLLSRFASRSAGLRSKHVFRAVCYTVPVAFALLMLPSMLWSARYLVTAAVMAILNVVSGQEAAVAGWRLVTDHTTWFFDTLRRNIFIVASAWAVWNLACFARLYLRLSLPAAARMTMAGASAAAFVSVLIMTALDHDQRPLRPIAWAVCDVLWPHE